MEFRQSRHARFKKKMEKIEQLRLGIGAIFIFTGFCITLGVREAIALSDQSEAEREKEYEDYPFSY